jgi:hypothetical protein
MPDYSTIVPYLYRTMREWAEDNGVPADDFPVSYHCQAVSNGLHWWVQDGRLRFEFLIAPSLPPMPQQEHRELRT